MPLSLSGDAGDFQIGKMLVDLTSTDIFSNGTGYSTPDEQYADFILHFAQAANIATQNVTTQQNVLDAASEKLLAVSGVSMDEELSNMVKFQYSYTAASKMITVVDEMLETILAL
jgi:flagellar hook-associated protein 1 FlgK